MSGVAICLDPITDEAELKKLLTLTLETDQEMAVFRDFLNELGGVIIS